MKQKFRTASLLLASIATAFTMSSVLAAEPPAKGKSPRIDAIRSAGELRVAVLHNTPWLAENTTGTGEPWSGPAWFLSNAFADKLGVKLKAVPVSNETKVPVLAANQVDITITPLAETPPRLKVIDYVLYSSTSVCLFGLTSNPKFAAAKTVDDFNSPDYTVAYLVGASEETWLKKRLPKAKLRGVITSSLIPIDEVLAKRADAAPINRIQVLALQRKVKGIGVLPRKNNCQDSTEKAQPVGMGIDKGQPVFLQWLRETAEELAKETQASELAIIKNQM